MARIFGIIVLSLGCAADGSAGNPQSGGASSGATSADSGGPESTAADATSGIDSSDAPATSSATTVSPDESTDGGQTGEDNPPPTAECGDPSPVAVAIPESSDVLGRVFPRVTLDDLPSAEGDHLTSVVALGAGESVELPAPAEDPLCGAARGRSFYGGMAFSRQHRAAFLYGTGVHGFVKPDGHYMDDFFAYDVMAHRWICIHRGVDPQMLVMEQDETGIEAALDDGERVPVAPGHGYTNQTYAPPPVNQFISKWRGGSSWMGAIPQRAGWFDTQVANAGDIAGRPVIYDFELGQWQRPEVTGSTPNHPYMVVEYVPSLERVVMVDALGGAFAYDPVALAFEDLAPTGMPIERQGWIEPIGALDRIRDRIYFMLSSTEEHVLSYYDIADNAWVTPDATGRPPGAIRENRPEGFSAQSAELHYDDQNDALLLVQRRPGEPFYDVHVYDIEASTWTSDPVASFPIDGAEMSHSFYDPCLNALFLFFATDSGLGRMLAYRYQ